MRLLTTPDDKVTDVIHIPLEGPDQGPIRFDRRYRIPIDRWADRLLYMYLRVKVAPLARGYRWRPQAQLRTVVRSSITWADTQMLVFSRESLEVRFLAAPLPYYNDSMFRPLAPGREHTYITPLHETELYPGLTMYHQNTLNIDLAALDDLVERDMSILDAAPLVDPILEAHVVCVGEVLRVPPSPLEPERRTDITLYPSETQVSRTDQYLTIDEMPGNLELAETYIHITSEEGQELSDEVLAKVRVTLNSVEHLSMSGYEARHIHRPVGTRDNIASENLYFVTFADASSHGLSMARFDRCHMDLHFKASAPPRVRVTVVHRVLGQVIRSVMGLMGLVSEVPYLHGRTSWMRDRKFETVASISIAPDAECPITMDPLREGQSIAQCRICYKAFDKAALDVWLEGSYVGSCPHCREGRAPYLTGPAVYIYPLVSLRN